MFKMKFIINYVFIIASTCLLIWLLLLNYASRQEPNTYQTALMKSVTALNRPVVFQCASTESRGMAYDEIVWNQSQFNLKYKNISLENFIKDELSAPILLEIESTLSPEQLGIIVRKLKEHKNFSQIMINSQSDGVLKYVRDLSPETSIGSGFAELTRLKGLMSFGLSKISPLKNDFVVLNPHWQKGIWMQSDFINELKKQQKLIFVGPVTNQSEISANYSSLVDGFIICSPRTTH